MNPALVSRYCWARHSRPSRFLHFWCRGLFRHTSSTVASSERRPLKGLPIAWDHSQLQLVRFFSALLSDGTVPMNPSALKEAVTHHALAEQKKEGRQEEYEQEMFRSE
jgi:hypothetical protein